MPAMLAPHCAQVRPGAGSGFLGCGFLGAETRTLCWLHPAGLPSLLPPRRFPPALLCAWTFMHFQPVTYLVIGWPQSGHRFAIRGV
jgi:hypothetical protein